MDKMMAVAPLGALDIFTPPPIQDSVENCLVTEHRPLNAITGQTNHPIVFQVYTQEDEYLLMSECELYLRFKIAVQTLRQKKAGDTADPEVDATDWAKIFTTNNFLHSFIKTIRLSINGNEITVDSQNYGYRAYIETLFGFSPDAKKSHLTCQGWARDAKGKMEGKGSVVAARQLWRVPNPKTNDKDKFNMEVEFEVQGKLHLDLTFQERALPGGTSLRIEIVPNDPRFYMMCEDDTARPTISLEDATFLAHRLKVSESIKQAHRKVFEKGRNALFPLTKVDVKTFTIPGSQRNFVQDNLFYGVIPRRLIIGFLQNTAYTGDYQLNPYNFKHYDLNYLTLFIGGSQIPAITLRPDYSKKLYVKTVRQMFRALNQDYTDSMTDIDMEEFLNGKVFYVVNLARDGGDGYGSAGHLSLPQSAPARLEGAFAKETPHAMTCVIYYETDGQLEISQRGEAVYKVMKWTTTM